MSHPRQRPRAAARGDYWPDTMSRPARRLAEMREVSDYWRNRRGPVYGYALAPRDMHAIADRACLDIAAALIAEGFAP